MRKRKVNNKSKGMAMAKAVGRAMISQVNFESFIREHLRFGEMEFKIIAKSGDDMVTLTIFPTADEPTILEDGQEPEQPFVGYLMHNSIEPKRAIDNIMKYFNQESKFSKVE